MRVDTFKCDVCGRIKGENNHWFRIDASGNGLELHGWGAVQAGESTVDLCSDLCVIKTVQQWLTAQAHMPHGKLAEVRVAGEVLFPRERVPV
jgi:hypothetical protein